ncbi:hypothetical protein AVEN_121244-1 [Araneus ventricosus]|uniref:Uncharacterized protein n=1 Tax=Araneus ventricosus TaxID=182803 RepID=A0A4Y2K2D5_ARAVE|nr:hypothetical protein AVEN_121244-1 [Araneus ventricosus]
MIRESFPRVSIFDLFTLTVESIHVKSQSHDKCDCRGHPTPVYALSYNVVWQHALLPPARRAMDSKIELPLGILSVYREHELTPIQMFSST